MTSAEAVSRAKANFSQRREITTHPIFAVIGVLLGALTSVFTGRLLSVGSADIQGALGVSSDFMSWVQTAYNAAQMFIGPLTVFMGALLGARRVLLWASVLFMLAEFLTPFAGHNPVFFVLLQAVSGLAAGTYYPLTFTIIIRNFSLKYLYLGIAIYGLDILASTHLGHLVESFYIDNLSWHWLFWNALVTTPLLMLAVYFGIPPQPLPAPKPGLSFSGFLYAATSLTLIYIALDQGERLDWLNSSLFSAFLFSGFFLALITCIRRRNYPNPMINLAFLGSSDFLILGLVLVCFRFVILTTTLLVPSYLSALHGYRPEQTAAALSCVSAVVLVSAPLAGLLLYQVNSKLLCAAGFFLVGATCVFNAHLDPGWTGETFFLGQSVLACGLTLGLAGLVASLLRAALKAGALKNPVNILTISCWFQTCRLFGAEIGKTFLAHFMKIQSDFHYSVLSGHIDGGFQTVARIGALAGKFSNGVSSPGDPFTTAAVSLSGALKQQITLLSISDAFMLVSMVCFGTIIALTFVSHAPPLVSPEAAKK